MKHPKREITEPSRRNIADELDLHGVLPYGRLDEVQFFSRIFNLEELPTRDSRRRQFPNMAADLWQHRVNNLDWDDGWWWTDHRLNLLRGPDETFLRFLAEIVHPLVRPDEAERELCLEVFNRNLSAEGWEIGAVSRVGAHRIYGGRRLEQMPHAVTAEARELAQTLGLYVTRQITRMESAIPNDPHLAIGTAKEFVETICKTILEERGINILENEDFPRVVRRAVRSLPIVPASIDDLNRWEGTITRLVNNLSSLGKSLAELRNAFGTGHGRTAAHIGLDAHHARLAVRMATTVGVFLYEVHERNPSPDQ